MKNPASTRKKVVAVIPSAGTGRRMGSKRGKKKNYLPLLGRPALARTLEAFEASGLVDSIILVVAAPDIGYCRRNIVRKFGCKKVRMIIPGGRERQDSVRYALNAITDPCDLVVVHDGARPLVTKDIIERTIKAAAGSGAAISAVPVKDTVKEASRGFVKRTVPRETLWSVQTPQAFRLDLIKRAYEKARKDRFRATDCSTLVERLGQKVKVVEGSYENIKITTQEDVAAAEAILRLRKR